MATIKDTFATCIQDALKSVKGISDPYNKTLAYAEIAKALAMTGLVGNAAGMDVAPEAAEVTEPETKQGKESLKEVVPKATKAKEKEVETKKVEKAEAENVSAVEMTEEWNEDMLALMAPHVDKMNAFIDEAGETAVDQCVELFTEGNFKTVSDITPLNIEAFVYFMEGLANQA